MAVRRSLALLVCDRDRDWRQSGGSIGNRSGPAAAAAGDSNWWNLITVIQVQVDSESSNHDGHCRDSLAQARLLVMKMVFMIDIDSSRA